MRVIYIGAAVYRGRSPFFAVCLEFSTMKTHKTLPKIASASLHILAMRKQTTMKSAEFWRAIYLIFFLLHSFRILLSMSFNPRMVLVLAIMASSAKLNEIYGTIIKMSEQTEMSSPQ